MKVACDTCQTKYTIADEKVQGRAYRVRCKKCGTTFIVRGDGDGAAEAAGPVATSAVPATAVWHILVAGVQRGPLSPDDIAALVASGEATLEHYAWREGLDGWKPMKEIAELASVAASAPPPEAPSPAPADAVFASPPPADEPEDDLPPPAPSGGIFTPSSPAAGLFAKPVAPEPAEEAPIAAVAGGRAKSGADLFAGLGAAAEAETEPEPAPSVGLTGARNENSVLFSLSALQSISSAGGGAKPQSTTSDSGAFPSFEGLKPVVSSPGKPDALDDIIHLGGASPFQPTHGAPVLAPAAQTSESRGLLYALFGVAFILLAGIIVLVFLLLRQPEEVARNEEGTARPDREAEPATTAPEPATTAPATAAPASTAPATTAPEKQTTRERERERETQREPEKQTTTRESDDPLDRLMNKVTKQEPRETAPRTSAPAPAGNATPDRAAVMSAMNSVSGAVRACATGQTGTANIRITFAGGSGRVTTAQVVGAPFAGTPAGSCMARAVRAATVPPFTNSTLSVTFPFVIR